MSTSCHAPFELSVRSLCPHRRDVACVNRLMEQLEDMQLITLEGFDPRDRANVSISGLIVMRAI